MWKFGELSLWAVSDVVVHLNRFENRDLYERGVYRLRVSLLSRSSGGGTGEDAGASAGSSSGPSGAGRREPCLPYAFSAAPRTLHSSAKGVLIHDAGHTLSTPSYIEDDGSAYLSRSFLVRYRDESFALNEIVQFRLLTNVSEGGFQNDVVARFDLCMAPIEACEEPPRWRQSGPFAVVATQTLALEPRQVIAPGIHAFYPLCFDDAHCCYADAMIHSTLVDLKFRTPPRSRRPRRSPRFRPRAWSRGSSSGDAAAAEEEEEGDDDDAEPKRRYHTLVELLFSNPTPEINAEIRSLASQGVPASRLSVSDADVERASAESLDALVGARADQLAALLVSSLQGAYNGITKTLRALAEATLSQHQWEQHREFAQLPAFEFPSGPCAGPGPGPGAESPVVPRRLSGSSGLPSPALESPGEEGGEGEDEDELPPPLDEAPVSAAPPPPPLPDDDEDYPTSEEEDEDDEPEADQGPVPLSARLSELTPESVSNALASDANFAAQQIHGAWHQFLRLLQIAPEALADRLRCEWEQQTALRWGHHVFSRTTGGAAASSEAELTATSAALRQSPLFSSPHPLSITDTAVFGAHQSLPVLVLDQYFEGEQSPRPAGAGAATAAAPIPEPLPWADMVRSMRDWTKTRRPCRLSHAFLTDACARCQHEPHLIVFAHGFAGSAHDLRAVANQLRLFFPQAVVLLARSNEKDSAVDLATMGNRLAREILECVEQRAPFLIAREGRSPCGRISLVGHSLGSLIARAALSDPLLAPYQSRLHAFVSLSSPHLGSQHGSALVNAGMWAFKLLRRARVLEQLALSDGSGGEPRESYLYRLSQYPTLRAFRHVVLVSSHQDQYVPLFSARAEPPGDVRDGAVYEEMVAALFDGVDMGRVTRINVDNIFAGKASVDTFIGRAAHIRLLDDPQLIQLLAFVMHQYLR